MGKFLGKYWVCVHALLSNKTEEMYNSFFRELKTLVDCTPTHVIVDFERGLINSIKTSFLTSEVMGCNFHFGQIIWKNITSFNLGNKYKSKNWQGKVMKKCINLAFIPKDDVLMEFEKISLNAQQGKKDERLNNFLIYFRKMFVAGSERPEPSYLINIWSCFDRVKQGIDRTTNVLESWHHKLNDSFNCAHPNLAAFVNILCQNEQEVFFNLTQMKGVVFYDVTGSNFKKEFILKT